MLTQHHAVAFYINICYNNNMQAMLANKTWVINPKKGDNDMLSITAKVRTLAKEMDYMIQWCGDLETTLKTTSSEAKFPEKIGDFARKMPELKILTKEREVALKLVRTVCTKETEIKDAIEILKTSSAELVKTRELIKL